MPEDLSFTVQGLSIAARAWGPPDGHPILAVHGWLDHADSFAVLAPCLTGCRVVAVDKPGHGDSDWHSPDATYNIWEDLPPLFGVLDALGWDRATLLGHSRGAMTCTLMAATRPERVSRLITLDALLPSPVEDADFVTQLRKHLDGITRRAAQTPRTYATKDAFLRRRIEAGNIPEVAEALSHRALAQVDGGYRVKADPRLQAASAMKMNIEQIRAVLQALEMPVLSLWASEGLGKTAWGQTLMEEAKAHVRDIRFGTWDGDHHGHLSAGVADWVAERVMAKVGR